MQWAWSSWGARAGVRVVQALARARRRAGSGPGMRGSSSLPENASAQGKGFPVSSMRHQCQCVGRSRCTSYFRQRTNRRSSRHSPPSWRKSPMGRAQGHDGGNRGQIPLVLALHFGQLPRKPQSTELKGPPPNPIRQTEPHTPNWERPGLYRGGAPGAGNPCHHQKFMCLVHERQGSCTTWGSQWKLRIAPLLISSRRLRQRAGPVPNTRMLHSWPVHFRPSMPTWANTCRNAGWDAGSALSFAGIACSLNLCGPAPSISTTCTHPGHESPQHRLRNDCRTPVTR